MKQLFYRIIYDPKINKILRNINKKLLPVLPKNIKISPSGIISIKHEKNSFKLKTNQTSYLAHYIFWKGHMNWEYTDIFLRLIKKVNSFYDIGANIGYYSLLAAMENPKMNIVSFEPATGPLFYLKNNIQLNHYSNIKLEPIALSHKTGEITFNEIKNQKYLNLDHTLSGEGNAGNNMSGRNFVAYNVPTMTLDNYVEINRVDNIDLIKMDTEGTENLILGQSRYVLEKFKPIIICETLFMTIEAELELILIQYGYEFFNHTEGGLKKVASIKRESDNGIRNCFFVHPSKYHLIAEFVEN